MDRNFVYQEIRKSALRDRRQGESEAAAVTRWVGDHPAAYRAYLDASPPRPVATSVATVKLAKGQDVLDRIEEKATTIRKSDPTLTREQATVKVLEADPGLYAQYEARLRGA